LGFHRGDPDTCGPTRSRLTVAHHRRGQRDWTFETVDTQEYLQVLAVTQANRPILAYPNPSDGTMNVARRRSNGTWRRQTLNVRSAVTGSPGFDTASDEDSYYVSYAGDSSDRVEFFQFDTTNPGQGWTDRASLMREDPSAAFERGLRADTGDSAYLVHRRNGRGTPYGLARYDKQEDRWAQTEYFDSAAYRVHSLEVTDDFQLCTAGDVGSTLHVTCGSMVDLDAQRWRFTNQPDVMALPPASMAVGDDGSLYVAFNTSGGADLRVAKLPPQSNGWRVTTIYGSESSGVSTDVAPDGRLIVSFFACDDPQTSRDACPLKVVRESPDSL
jgi:hypothetical protein